jgi:pullulanase/glycogen debranching enzyme
MGLIPMETKLHTFLPSYTLCQSNKSPNATNSTYNYRKANNTFVNFTLYSKHANNVILCLYTTNVVELLVKLPE